MGLKVTDEKGLKYNISEKKKNGEITAAYHTISQLPKFGVGLNKCFKFVTVANKMGGQSRYVRIITDPEGGDGKTTYTSPRMDQSKPVKTEATDWDKISWGKCKHAYLVEAFKSNGSSENLKIIEPIAEEWAEASMRKLEKEAPVNEAPVNIEDLGQEIPVGEIPF